MATSKHPVQSRRAQVAVLQSENRALREVVRAVAAMPMPTDGICPLCQQRVLGVSSHHASNCQYVHALHLA